MIENTSKRDPFLHLFGTMSGGVDQYVTDMEASGQQQLVAGTEMPKSGPWDELEALGFVRGDDVDDLFVHATLPEGWRKERTDHSMHSKIVDERGVERVSVFYKAAFYDRRASFHTVRVGYTLASEAVWGDGPVALPASWSALTADECREYVEALAERLENEIEYFKYFEGDELAERRARADRIRALIALVPAGGVE